MTLSYAICCTVVAQSACSWAHIMCNKIVPYEWVACRQAQTTSTEARRALALASVATMAKCSSQNGQTLQSLYAGYCTAKMKMLYTSELTPAHTTQCCKWPPHELNWTMAARAAMKQFAYPAACTIA